MSSLITIKEKTMNYDQTHGWRTNEWRRLNLKTTNNFTKICTDEHFGKIFTDEHFGKMFDDWPPDFWTESRTWRDIDWYQPDHRIGKPAPIKHLWCVSGHICLCLSTGIQADHLLDFKIQDFLIEVEITIRNKFYT